MANKTSVTWLEKLEEQLSVDVDWMDPEYIKTMPIVPHDQTSNQLLVDIELGNPSNAELLKQTARDLKEQGWLHIYTRMAVLMAKKNIDHIKERVLLQTLPSKAYDEQATIDHARLYDQEFKRVGISRKRYCIKIPATGPALNAAKVLSQDKDEDGLGIPTLGTAIFGLSQAIASSQADMLYISPYFNEIRAHDNLSLWPDVEDPATQHPISARTIQMLETYRRMYKETGKPQPKMKLASFISAKEAMAAAEFGCHSATLPPKVIDELARLEYDGTKQPGAAVPKPQPEVEFYQSAFTTPPRLQKLASTDPLAAKDWDGKLASTDIDYLANGGVELERAIQKDPITDSRLKEALKIFTAAENRSKEKIETALAAL
ncbi:Transaldolase [Cytospora mali]|uniref:Transaldolase n=1 Tax=Cytospora mali TaxID=578113 RepID=A0A194VSE2_CYTMA|nr:Transaldolase [Valsa mali]